MSQRRRSRKLEAVKNTGPVLRAYELQHRERELLALLREYPNRVVRGLALQKEAGWQVGRLYLVGVLEHDQYKAAEHVERVTKAYEGMLVRHGQVRAANFAKTSGTPMEDLSQSAQKKMLRAKKLYDEVYGILKECGSDTEKAVLKAIKEDKITKLHLLKNGLTVLATLIRK